MAAQADDGVLLAPEAARPQGGDRRQDRQGNRVAAQLPEQRRPRLPVARPVGGNAVRRRSAAHPPCFADRLGTDGRDVCAGRAVDRPAPARQRPAAGHAQASARSRQQRHRRRARPRRDHDGRLCRRHGPGRRRARRPGRRARHARRDPSRAAFVDGAISGGSPADSDTCQASSGGPGADTDHHRCVGQQSARRHAATAGGIVRLRDRRIGFRQVDADQRHAVPRRFAPPVRQLRRARAVSHHRRARSFRQGDQRRPESDRPHAAVESGDVHRTVHADSRTVRAGEGGARARLRAGALLV